jgi:hypothetical protein
MWQNARMTIEQHKATRWRFDLRSLIVAVTVVCVCLSIPDSLVFFGCVLAVVAWLVVKYIGESAWGDCLFIAWVTCLVRAMMLPPVIL